MPAKKPTPEAMPSKELVLAAIERAELHRIKHDDPVPYRGKSHRPGVLLSVIKQHLGLASGGATTVRLRPTWNELQADGLIEQGRAHGMNVWKLTDAGKKHLARARKAGDIGSLPEAPQHRLWREARAIAASRSGEFGDMLQVLLGQAAGLLDSHEAADSDTWHALGQRLQRACERLASANYCLYEWPEPDDSRPDTPAYRKAERRGIHRFDDD
jgi:DNA-binding PadR family transcriptional regulator